MPMRSLLVLALAGCTSRYIGPGIALGPGWQHSRDPDLTRNPTEQLKENPWAGEHSPAGGRSALGGDPSSNDDDDPFVLPNVTRDKLGFLAAWALLGFKPMLLWTGTFEENALAPHVDDAAAGSAAAGSASR